MDILIEGANVTEAAPFFRATLSRTPTAWAWDFVNKLASPFVQVDDEINQQMSFFFLEAGALSHMWSNVIEIVTGITFL